ncbi:hypothetical protein ACQUD9_08600 [Vagococcus fluvialis]|uniref:hypothetical protein n=1 Tax=Vagococcus fluvialis TaxID=2738 RepID=UPI003D0B4CE9
MKKTYFMKSYNFNFNLFLLSIVTILICLMLKLLSIFLKNEVLLSYTSMFLNIANILTNLVIFGILLSLIFSICYIISICIEIVERLISDSLNNFFKSIFQTEKLRRFLFQNEQKNTADEYNQNAVNPTNIIFNKSVKKCYVDIRKQGVSVLIQIPKTQQAQKVLIDMEKQIKEEISGQNPNFFFSSYYRVGNKMWLKGTRR